MSLRVEVDRGLCIGSSNCMEESPEAYAVDERGMAVVRQPQASDAEILAGARACPVDAIRVYDAVTGRRVHP